MGTDLQTRIIRELHRALHEDQSQFPESIRLPQHFAVGLPERAVEILFARLTYAAAKRVLDVGYVNTMTCHREMLASLPHPRRLTGIDIAKPSRDAAKHYERTLQCDVTRTPFADNSFDLIWCISSLEHFGMDNSGYTEEFTTGESMDARALQEMLRIVVPQGQILLTVPYGRHEDHGTHRNLGREHWQSLLALGRASADVREWYFRHTFGGGWHEVAPEELRYVGYYDQANAGAGGLAVTLMTKR